MEISIPIKVAVRTVTTEVKTFDVVFPIYSKYNFSCDDIEDVTNLQYTRLDENMTKYSLQVFEELSRGEKIYTLSIVPNFEFTGHDQDCLGFGEFASSAEEFNSVVESFKASLLKLREDISCP